MIYYFVYLSIYLSLSVYLTGLLAFWLADWVDSTRTPGGLSSRLTSQPALEMWLTTGLNTRFTLLWAGPKKKVDSSY